MAWGLRCGSPPGSMGLAEVTLSPCLRAVSSSLSCFAAVVTMSEARKRAELGLEPGL